MSDAAILTFTKRTLDLASPRAEDVDVWDVAHALSLLCRYGGHAPHFYSVAEHSLLVEELAGDLGVWSAAERLSFLMHDAQEAYLGDVVAPLKALLPDYRQLEEQWASAVREKFDLPWDERVRTKVAEADRLVRFSEQDFFAMPREHVEYSPRLRVLSERSDALGGSLWLKPGDACERFLRRFNTLCQWRKW